MTTVRPRAITQLSWLWLFLLAACQTAAPQSKPAARPAPEPAAKASEGPAGFSESPLARKAAMPSRPVTACYCGWLRTAEAAPRTCGIWAEAWDGEGRQPVIAAKELTTCRVSDCQREFQDHASECPRFTAWTEPALIQTAVEEPCYCDFAPVEGDAHGKEACAIWKPGDESLREYHFTDTCDFTTCANPPFTESASYCGGRFQKFY